MLINEKLTKRYGCSKDHIERSLIAHMFLKLEEIEEDSSGISVAITESEILKQMKASNYPFRIAPELSLISPRE